MNRYFEMLKKNEEFFSKAFEIAKDVKEKAKEILGDCEVYIIGSFARGEHTLSSDLDILIVSELIPEKPNFEKYCEIVREISEDPRINIHLLNKSKFEELKSFYGRRIEI